MGFASADTFGTGEKGGEAFDEVVAWWVKPFVPPTWPPLVFDEEELERRNRRITEGDDEEIEEDSEDIEDYLGRVMQHKCNECNETFELGREFGCALSICEDYTERLVRLDYPSLWQAALAGRHPTRADGVTTFGIGSVEEILREVKLGVAKKQLNMTALRSSRPSGVNADDGE